MGSCRVAMDMLDLGRASMIRPTIAAPSSSSDRTSSKKTSASSSVDSRTCLACSAVETFQTVSNPAEDAASATDTASSAAASTTTAEAPAPETSSDDAEPSNTMGTGPGKLPLADSCSALSSFIVGRSLQTMKDTFACERSFMESNSRLPPSWSSGSSEEYSTPMVKTLLGFFSNDLRTGAVPQVVAEDNSWVGDATAFAFVEGFIVKASATERAQQLAIAIDSFQKPIIRPVDSVCFSRLYL
mmetsp:Transcript_30089/g.64493  ORF Transcript_30089/g.64493 Transcript_30089/m.64493 type:complete len:243 (+) Transcript_30089:532-1260(+)